MKKTTVKQRALILVLSAALLFGGYNLFWALSVALPYAGYASGFEQLRDDADPGRVSYTKEVDGYILEVKKPGYLDFNSFLSVRSKNVQYIELDTKTGEIIGSSGISVYLYLWPDLRGGCEYGVLFDDEAQDIFEQLKITSDMTYLPQNPYDTENNKRREQLLKDNYDAVSGMLQAAEKVWHFE